MNIEIFNLNDVDPKTRPNRETDTGTEPVVHPLSPWILPETPKEPKLPTPISPRRPEIQPNIVKSPVPERWGNDCMG